MNNELQKEFLQKYDAIIKGKDEKDMERLGAMVKRVMRWLINEEPALAEQAIRMLDNESDMKDVRNYLTEEEARSIIEQMRPQPTWSMEALEQSLPSLGLRLQEPPYYNKWALLTYMLMIQSDDGETLHEVTNMSPNGDLMLRAIYKLALDKLKDQDKRFNIRRYFSLSE